MSNLFLLEPKRTGNKERANHNHGKSHMWTPLVYKFSVATCKLFEKKIPAIIVIFSPFSYSVNALRCKKNKYHEYLYSNGFDIKNEILFYWLTSALNHATVDAFDLFLALHQM